MVFNESKNENEYGLRYHIAKFKKLSLVVFGCSIKEDILNYLKRKTLFLFPDRFSSYTLTFQNRLNAEAGMAVQLSSMKLDI